MKQTRLLLSLNIFLWAAMWTIVIFFIFLFTKWFIGWHILAIMAVWLIPIIVMAWRGIQRSHQVS